MSFRQYRPFEKGEHVLVGGDPSTGMGDYSVCIFLSRQHLDIPLVYQSKSVASKMTTDIYPILNTISEQTGVKPTIAYERNNGGVFEMDRLAALNRAGSFDIFQPKAYGTEGLKDTNKLGWDTNTATRPAMLSQLKEAIDQQLITIPDRHIINELLSFVIVQTSSAWKAQAESGAHDDLVMALAIAWQMYHLAPQPKDMRNTYQEVHQMISQRESEDFY